MLSGIPQSNHGHYTYIHTFLYYVHITFSFIRVFIREHFNKFCVLRSEIGIRKIRIKFSLNIGNQ
ncbi:hypothetical protein K435DRAFT_1982 [Dendrothele bispora CBS 962.96]|uniref:Uncharacterized protein n=1 Tax=Dendrothele bispora (strain CBS 962.96) TaxID=1314807 RepID=A0A4S8MYI0_DENBC|nr:hypothetical protein K435DRAFT_1982 [Dendrothele bispora CBS 962.96]